MAAALVLWLLLSVWPDWLVSALGSKKAFVNAVFNGITVAGLYFLVASGFTLVFGLMRNVNLAHGSLYLLSAYIGYTAAQATASSPLRMPRYSFTQISTMASRDCFSTWPAAWEW